MKGNLVLVLVGGTDRTEEGVESKEKHEKRKEILPI